VIQNQAEAILNQLKKGKRKNIVVGMQDELITCKV
jgi:hypothetical protein